jgi:hypothetical protein
MSYLPFSRIIARIIPKIGTRDDLERAYLDGSVSLYDLECREREIDRGKFAHVSYGIPGIHSAPRL